MLRIGLAWALMVAFALLFGVLPTSVSTPGDTQYGITTPWPVESLGITTMTSDQGALRLEPGKDLSGLFLQADSVTVETKWQKGVRADSVDFPTRLSTEHDSQQLTLRDAQVVFEPFQNEPVLVPFGQDSAINLSLSSAQGFSFIPDEDPSIISVGASPESVSAGSDPPAIGFWYTQEGPTIQARSIGASGTLRMEGSFSLFVNDVTVEASGSNMNLSQWTGYLEKNPDGPATEYEKRVTVIHVDNGTFVASSVDDLRLFSPALEIDVDGIVTSTGVTGRLLQGRDVFLFDNDPLRIRGAGSVPLGVEKTQADGSLRLTASATGSFDVQGASQVKKLPDEQVGMLSGPFSFMVAGGMLSVVVLAGVLVSGVGFLPLPFDVRERLYDRWIDRGRDARDQGAWKRAIRCFRLAMLTKVGDSWAWYEWAQTELEKGDGVRAEKIALKGTKVPGMDPMDILDLRAAAAWQRHDLPAFHDHLAVLAENAPLMALSLIKDLNVDRSILDAKTNAALSHPDLKGDLQAYA